MPGPDGYLPTVRVTLATGLGSTRAGQPAPAERYRRFRAEVGWSWTDEGGAARRGAAP